MRVCTQGRKRNRAMKIKTGQETTRVLFLIFLVF